MSIYGHIKFCLRIHIHCIQCTSKDEYVVVTVDSDEDGENGKSLK